MKRILAHTFALVTCLGIAACGDDTGALERPDTSVADGDSSSAPDAAISEAGAGIDGGTSIRGIAVVHSDYQSASVSFLDRDGNVVKDGCFSSGTQISGATLTLSGDVALPTQMPIGGDVVVVDRGNAVLTWLDATTCAPLRQLAVGTGFSSNPHDYVAISPSKAYVTRYEENGAPTATPADFDEGDDLLIVDPAQAKIVGRIDLKPFAPTGVLPRADRALLAEGKVFVSLNAIDPSYKLYGAGRILVIDPTADLVTGTIDLPGQKNCGAMTYVAAERQLLIACTGDYSNSLHQAETSAVAVVDLTGVLPKVSTLLGASAVGGTPFSNATIGALDGSHVLAVSMGDFSNIPPDRLWSLSTKELPGKIFESAEAFALGAVLVDLERRRVFLTEGTTNAPASVRTFDAASGEWKASGTIKTNPTGKLPPRGLGWF